MTSLVGDIVRENHALFLVLLINKSGINVSIIMYIEHLSTYALETKTKLETTKMTHSHHETSNS